MIFYGSSPYYLLLTTYPMFITFEGPEGSGKTTQIQRLSRALLADGRDVITTREPGGTRIGDGVRALLLDAEHREMHPATEALLFNAARAQLVNEVIRPALASGKIVLCDRYIDSTLAYQGHGHGQPLADLLPVINFTTGGLLPDLTVYLDIEAQMGLQRKRLGDGGLPTSKAEWNRMEEQTLHFHQRVRQGYLALAAAEPLRWLLVDARRGVDAVAAEIFDGVQAALSTPSQPEHVRV